MSKGIFEFNYPEDKRTRFYRMSLSSGDFVLLMPQSLNEDDLEDIRSYLQILQKQINRQNTEARNDH